MKHGKIALVLSAGVIAAASCAELQTDRPAANPAALMQKARGILIAQATSDSALLRAHAIEALAETGQRQAMQFVLAGLDDEYWGVRFAACLAVLETRYEPAAALIAEKLNDPDLSVRAAAAATMHVLGDERHTSVLGRTLFSKDVIVRRNTAFVLGRMGEPAAVKLLKGASRDDDISVRLQVTEAMALLGSKRAQRLMITYCRSGFDDEAILAMLALGKVKCVEATEQIAYVYEQSGSPARLGMRLVAARALAMLGDDRGRKVAIRALRYRSGKPEDAVRIRKLAAVALAELANPANAGHLQRLLDDPDPDVKISGAMAILRSLGQ